MAFISDQDITPINWFTPVSGLNMGNEKAPEPNGREATTNHGDHAGQALPPKDALNTAETFDEKGESEKQAINRKDFGDSPNRQNAQKFSFRSRFWKRWDRYVELLLIAVLALLAFVQAIVSYRQWEVTKGQLDQMATQSDLYKGQLEVAKGQLEQAKSAGAQTDKQIELAQGQLEQAKVASKQTDAIIEQMRSEQRPWIGASLPVLEPLVRDERIKCHIPMVNSGHTPGIIDVCNMGVFLTPSDQDVGSLVKAFAGDAARHPRENVLPPQGVTNFVVEDAPFVSKDDLDDINSRKTRLWVIGAIRNHDIDGKSHMTVCCFYYDTTANIPMGYEKYNYME